MEQKEQPLGRLLASTCISVACVFLAIGAILWPVSGHAELPASPEALIQELQDALSSRNLTLYSELIANDFEFMASSELDVEILDRQQELDIMGGFFTHVARFEVELEILTQNEG